MRNARITEYFGDDEYDFRLAYGQLLELQEKTGVGPFALYRRFMADDWGVADIFETIRIGLIGGGMTPRDAFKLAKKYVQNDPPLTWLTLARMILIVGLHGAPDEDKMATPEDDEEAQDDESGKLKSRQDYGIGAVMGYSPQDVDEMSLHQRNAAFEGYADFHNQKGGGMSEKDKDDLFAMVQEEQRKIDGEV
jgi:hypothetical protein